MSSRAPDAAPPIHPAAASQPVRTHARAWSWTRAALGGGFGQALAHAQGSGARGSAQDARAALKQAMAIEQVPASWESGLHYIMMQESSGRVGVRNPHHSARGLFQLTAANYAYNPHGAASFGNAVEETQGGIRYIRSRYGTAENAVAFWQAHHWY